MTGLFWVLLGALAVAGFHAVNAMHGEGLPLATGGEPLPAWLDVYALWTACGGFAAVVTARGLGLLGFPERFAGLRRGSVPLAALAGGLVALGLQLAGPGFAPPVGALAHLVAVPAIARLVEGTSDPRWGRVAAWAWALCPGLLLPAATPGTHAVALTALVWAAVWRDEPGRAALLLLVAVALRPVSALVPACVLAATAPVLFAGIAAGLVLAGVGALALPGRALPAAGPLDRALAPALALVHVQAALGWPLALGLAVLARPGPWVAMLVGGLATAAALPSFGPDTAGPLALHELLLPAFVLVFQGAVRLGDLLDRRSEAPGWMAALVLVTTAGWLVARAITFAS